jgi:hypothetical protein
MWSENRELAVIALVGAICAGFAFSSNYEFLTMIFALESSVAIMLAIL